MTGVHHAIAAGFAFGVGGSVGSCLNVCVWRLPRGESLIRPPSRCPRCGSAVAARDNVPVLGWLLLRGRCRRCAGAISARYPLVEAAVGFLFAAVVLAETLSGTLDLLDRGPWLALARVGYHGALVALMVTAGLIEHDRLRPDPLRHGRSPAPDPFAPAAALVAWSACLAGGPLGALLNVALFTVFLRAGGWLPAGQPGLAFRLPSSCRMICPSSR